jgi:hypothetical protein
MENSVMKILNVSVPPITSFFHIDIPLSIIYSDIETHHWIYSNYIQLYSIHNIERSNPCFIDFHHSINGAFRFLELATCPWILFERISREDVFNKWGSIIEFVKEKINKDKYIGITVDARKIKNYINTNMHNLFIYGYNEEKKVLYTADHFRDGVFNFEEVNYDEFSNSVLYPYEEDLNWGNLEGICIFSKIRRKHENIYNLDLRKIIYDMKSYLLLEGYAYKNDEYYIYGIECYDNLIKYYSLALEYGSWCDLKGIHTEICHKTMMVLRLKFLQGIGYDTEGIIDNFESIRNNLMIVENSIIKYEITKKKKNLESSIDKLRKIKVEEINAFNKLISKLLTYIPTVNEKQ